MEEIFMVEKISRNAKCPCGSGKKYKICCMNKVPQNQEITMVPNEYKRIINEMESRKIPIDLPGFYNNQNFISQERRDPKYLEEYARFVRDKPYSDDYLEKAAQTIPHICSILHDELVRDGAHGACVNMSIALSKILESEGFWNYIVKGALTIKFPTESKITPSYFWPVDQGNFDAGHAWVVAPPFSVIDLTVKQQPYQRGEFDYIPDFILSDTKDTDTIQIEDIYSLETRRYFGLMKETQLKNIDPEVHRIAKDFIPRKIIHDRTILKYTTVGISMSDGDMKDITGFSLNGNSVETMYKHIIKPAL